MGVLGVVAHPHGENGVVVADLHHVARDDLGFHGDGVHVRVVELFRFGRMKRSQGFDARMLRPPLILQTLVLAECQGVGEERPRVGHSPDLDGVLAADLERVALDLDDLRFLGDERPVDGVHVEEPAAQSHHHIGAPQGLVGRAPPEVAGDPEAEGVVFRDGAPAHLRSHDRNRKPLGQLHQLIGGLGPDHPPAGEDDGVAGPGQKPAGPLDGFGVGPGGVRDEGGAASRQGEVRALDFHRLFDEVFGKVQVDGAGHSRGRDLKGGPQEPLDVLGLAELVAPFGDPLIDAVHAELVPEVASQAEGVQVPRQDDEGDGVLLGDVRPQDAVGDPGPHMEQGAAGLAGDPGIRVGHGGGAVLHPARHVADLILPVVQGVQDGKNRVPRDAGDEFDPLVDQVLDEILRGGVGACALSFLPPRAIRGTPQVSSSTTAMALISTMHRESVASFTTSTVTVVGLLPVKYSAQTAFIASCWDMSVTKRVHSTTSSKVAPTASRLFFHPLQGRTGLAAQIGRHVVELLSDVRVRVVHGGRGAPGDEDDLTPVDLDHRSVGHPLAGVRILPMNVFNVFGHVPSPPFRLDFRFPSGIGSDCV